MAPFPAGASSAVLCHVQPGPWLPCSWDRANWVRGVVASRHPQWARRAQAPCGSWAGGTVLDPWRFPDALPIFKRRGLNQRVTAGRQAQSGSRDEATERNHLPAPWLMARGPHSAGTAPLGGGARAGGGGGFDPLGNSSYSFTAQRMEVPGAPTEIDSETEMTLTKE